MAQIKGIDAHDRPPDIIRQCYKKYTRLPLSEVDNDPGIIDLQKVDPESESQSQFPAGLTLSQYMSSQDLRLAFDAFIQGDHSGQSVQCDTHAPLAENVPVYTHDAISGLLIIPALFPPTIQTELLSRLFHRDLSNPLHKTNLHLHYDVTYPGGSEDVDTRTTTTKSFFSDDPTRTIQPKDLQVHKPLTVQNVLDKKLRWVTLGGQYDWTAKVYPEEAPPPFPQDIAELLRAAFPQTEAQAAILNLYSAGDTLSVHRDVSEDCDVGLISVSFGCDGLFLVSHDDGNGCEVFRLRSGDAVYMNGASRFAWHGVPKILPSTCPSWLADWPSPEGDDGPGAASDPFPMWKGWMSGKRVNLNVRQMINPPKP
ncbi:Oxoglutarate/iron-dependent dioxygenase [Penicillium cosmopolitanum]|uniref:mRNA N(6)-methyladenine demethylase n=1 Tax=Penicillium cosmopolitanum TaxID=1131564 RepID=A0A9W9VRC4_9EURO|nr:Oxoglutarate/iron-dependent dioxygenase [Penicillium cosmopolitanum]KAJ5387749.1 Oxoglutarate/iron-dependent dioxygenase [Penicillium cosmopolitanum]